MINEVMISQGRNVGMERTEWVRIHLQSDMEDKGDILAWMTWCEIWNTGGQGPSFAGVGEEKCTKELILDVLI